MSRGLTNNNAGNIKLSTVIYQGEKQPSTDSTFKQFISPAWGYRAIFVLLRYYSKHRAADTIRKIISTYAPPPDDTEAYIRSVVAQTGIGENQKLDINDWVSYGKIVAAISRVENGVPAVTKDLIDGMNLAKAGTVAPEPKKKGSGAILFGLALGIGAALIFGNERT